MYISSTSGKKLTKLSFSEIKIKISIIKKINLQIELGNS